MWDQRPQAFNDTWLRQEMCASNTMTPSHSLQSSCPTLLYVSRTMGARFIRQVINSEG